MIIYVANNLLYWQLYSNFRLSKVRSKGRVNISKCKITNYITFFCSLIYPILKNLFWITLIINITHNSNIVLLLQKEKIYSFWEQIIWIQIKSVLSQIVLPRCKVWRNTLITHNNYK